MRKDQAEQLPKPDEQPGLVTDRAEQLLQQTPEARDRAEQLLKHPRGQAEQLQLHPEDQAEQTEERDHLSQPLVQLEEEDWSSLVMDRAEHLLRQDNQLSLIRCQAEQPLQQSPEARNQAEHQSVYEDGTGTEESRAEQLPKPQEAENQAEQHNHPSLETYRAEPLDQPPEAECQAEQATQPELTDQAEQEWQLRRGLG